LGPQFLKKKKKEKKQILKKENICHDFQCVLGFRQV